MEVQFPKPQQQFITPWTIFIFIFTFFVHLYLFNFVDLVPKVDNDFFFSSEDSPLQSDMEISKLFERKDSQIIISVNGDIFADNYQNRIEQLSNLIETVESVISVKSITHGPASLEDAIKGPLWKRVLISNNLKASNIVVIVDEQFSNQLIPKIEQAIELFQAPDFQINISGFPFAVELIRRNLIDDLNVFSLLAVIIFSVILRLIFHSWRVLIGMIITCANAGAITFIITDSLGVKIGILTANLVTIIFVLTLSHMVFLTYNWRLLNYKNMIDEQGSSLREAIGMTLPASFWSMITTLLGFISLLFVEAKPLRELGISGSIGTVVSFLGAYLIYPIFLQMKTFGMERADRIVHHYFRRFNRNFEKAQRAIIVAIMFCLIITAPYLWKLNTDPSLISYFDPDSEITKGLMSIDVNGGSSPLVMVINDGDLDDLVEGENYERLVALQTELEDHPDVGTIIGLPTLLQEGKRNPLGYFISPRWLVKLLEDPKFDRISRSFITKDRKNGLFLMRMNEMNRVQHRLNVIAELKSIVAEHGFETQLVGGIYALQGHLSKHIASSLIYGLARLIAIFTLIAMIVSFSLRISIAMILSISIIPLCILGTIGAFRVPLDTISAPAANLAIAMGIDAMIHMVTAYRRIGKSHPNDDERWTEVRKIMWEPVVTSMLVVCTGFGIFFFSSFPPTQRFGGAIVFGSFVAAMTALYVFPMFARKAD